MFETKGKIRTIWNSEINLEDWKEWIEAMHPESINYEDKQYKLIVKENKWMLDDEVANLDKYLDNKIIIIADLGLWNGRKQGCKLLGSNLNNIFEIGSFDNAHWYYDRYDVKCINPHHDGTNYYIFRELKDDKYWDSQIVPKILNQTLTKKDITRYTRSLKPYVKNIYGV